MESILSSSASMERSLIAASLREIESLDLLAFRASFMSFDGSPFERDLDEKREHKSGSILLSLLSISASFRRSYDLAEHSILMRSTI